MTDIYADKAQIELAKAINANGVEVGALTMREPTVADQLSMQALKGNEGEQEVFLFANLCDVEPKAIKSMTLRDYAKLQAAYQSFIA
ncbi:phage tail assembly protein [Terasakiella sp.]|uniref:phage tail assembly protein n=1 Tax=Terasakiella sp. TaxID=2034861 RepID=UPI003AA9B1BC